MSAGKRLALACSIALGWPLPAGAALYWDTNGTAFGPGDAPAGTWDSATPNWSTSSQGLAATQIWTPGENAIFAAGIASSPYTVTISGTQSASGLTIQQGLVTLEGEGINLASPA